RTTNARGYRAGFRSLGLLKRHRRRCRSTRRLRVRLRRRHLSVRVHLIRSVVCISRLRRGLRPGIILVAALHQQGQQTDTVNGQDEKDRDLYTRTALVFLLHQGAQWIQRTFVIHFFKRSVVYFIEAFVLLSFLFAPGFSLKKPRSKLLFVFLPSLLGFAL